MSQCPNPAKLILNKAVPVFKKGLNFFIPEERESILGISLTYSVGKRKDVIKRA